MKVLFLCTGNSCRSQMAEGFMRELAGERVAVISAGLEAHGKNPRAIAVMQEAGVDISEQESTEVTDEMIHTADIVVTVCGHADEFCPSLPPGTRRIHWPLPDPAKAQGTDNDILEQFRSVRDDIRGRVEALIRDELNKEVVR